MTIRKIVLGLLGVGLLFGTPVVAQTTIDFENIDTILEDNEFSDIANRYASLLLSFFPERASHLGFASGNSRLDDRSPQRAQQALTALKNLRQQLNNLEEESLSPAKQADRQLLLNDIDYMIWLGQRNRSVSDPLYYAEALDAVYELRVKPHPSPFRQRSEIADRLKLLSQVANQAEQYLTQAPAFQAQLAMEKAYYAFLSMDELASFLAQTAPDPEAIRQIKEEASSAKQAIKRLFDLFKRLSQEENSKDFRLGTADYKFLLNNQYQIDRPVEGLVSKLQQDVQTAQQDLTRALEPFMQDIRTAELTVIDENNPIPTEAAVASGSTESIQVEEPFSGLRNAQDFYAVSKRIVSVNEDQASLQTVTENVANAIGYFREKGILPVSELSFQISEMPQFYTYTDAYLFLLPYNNQPLTQSTFFLRLPEGNKLAKQEQLNRDFNESTKKLMIASELIPGHYYQTVANENMSAVRRLYPAVGLVNGWEAYAQELAKQQGYLISDEDLLFFAWGKYIQALKALVDAKLNTRQFSYADALDLLTQEHGVEQAQAEALIKEVVLRPGEALSFQSGLEILQNTYKKYQKKQGKKFNEADFYQKLLRAGNLTPASLDKELSRFYKKAKKS